MRWLLLGLAVAVAGCGKSFQEANAIYEDEVAKYEAMNESLSDMESDLFDKHLKRFSGKDQNAIVAQSLSHLRGDNPSFQKTLDQIYAPLKDEYARLKEQGIKVEKARLAKEAAK